MYIKYLTKKERKRNIMTIQELETFIGAHGRSIYAFCRRLCQNTEQAEELYQDVWLKAMQELPDIESTGNVKSYLLSLAIGMWQNRRRKAAWRNRIAPKKELTDETDAADQTPDALTGILADERKRAVLAAVRRLDDIYRIPILLYYMEEMQINEIAAALHIPAGTVKRRLFTARARLKKELEEYIYDV